MSLPRAPLWRLLSATCCTAVRARAAWQRARAHLTPAAPRWQPFRYGALFYAFRRAEPVPPPVSPLHIGSLLSFVVVRVNAGAVGAAAPLPRNNSVCSAGSPPYNQHLHTPAPPLQRSAYDATAQPRALDRDLLCCYARACAHTLPLTAATFFCAPSWCSRAAILRAATAAALLIAGSPRLSHFFLPARALCRK